MAKTTNAKHGQDLIEEDERVTSLELFFDLVFVFTLTQLTALLAKSLSWESLLQYLQSYRRIRIFSHLAATRTVSNCILYKRA